MLPTSNIIPLTSPNEVNYSQLKVLSIITNYGSAPLNTFLHSLMFESEVQSMSDYNLFDYSANPVQSITRDTQYLASQGDLLVSWASILATG